jgi:hypothetical protein
LGGVELNMLFNPESCKKKCVCSYLFLRTGKSGDPSFKKKSAFEKKRLTFNWGQYDISGAHGSVVG